MSDDLEGPDLEAGIDPAEVPAGAFLQGRWRGKPVLLVNADGRHCAFGAMCTHMGAPLRDGIFTNGELRCPWHHARFSVTTGEAVGAPAFAPLERFETVVRDGCLFLTRPAAPSPGPAQIASDARVVIIGAGAGGHACAQWLGRSGFAGSVTVFSDDIDPPYDRTVCSKQYLIGMKSREETLIGDDALGRSPGRPVLRLGCRVQSIDIGDKTLRLEGGERTPFDVLVLATGAEPRRLPVSGFDLPNVHVLRTLRDADELIEASRRARRVAVIGASFIGMEVAASLRQRRLEVHIVTPEDVPLKKLLGHDVGTMLRAVHEEQGVHFHVGRQARSFDGRRLLLDDGSEIEADFVVLGIGVTPRTALAQAAGLACTTAAEGGGVIVDERLQSSVPGIFAVGDIARYPDPHTGHRIRVEHWVHAERQGQHVARVILNQAGRYADVPFFWSAHFDTGLRYLGHVDSILESRTQGSAQARDFSRHLEGQHGQKAFVTCNRDKASLIEEAAWERAVASIGELSLRDAVTAIASEDLGSPGAGAAGALALALAAACLSKATAITLKHDPGHAALHEARASLTALAMAGLRAASGDAQAFARTLSAPGTASLNDLLEVEGDAQRVRVRLARVMEEVSPLIHPSMRGDVTASRTLLAAAREIFDHIQRETLEALHERRDTANP